MKMLHCWMLLALIPDIWGMEDDVSIPVAAAQLPVLEAGWEVAEPCSCGADCWKKRKKSPLGHCLHARQHEGLLTLLSHAVDGPTGVTHSFLQHGPWWHGSSTAMLARSTGSQTFVDGERCRDCWYTQDPNIYYCLFSFPPVFTVFSGDHDSQTCSI